MPTHVYANNNEVASKAADGKSIAAFPDVCFSPPAPPVGPMPLPYPNTGEVKDTDSGTAKVFIKDKMSGMGDDSHMTKSMGDEAATQNFNKGMITSALQGKCYFGLWSMDVQMEGKGVPRHLDMVTHNHGSMVGSSTGPEAALAYWLKKNSDTVICDNIVDIKNLYCFKILFCDEYYTPLDKIKDIPNIFLSIYDDNNKYLFGDYLSSCNGEVQVHSSTKMIKLLFGGDNKHRENVVMSIIKDQTSRDESFSKLNFDTVTKIDVRKLFDSSKHPYTKEYPKEIKMDNVRISTYQICEVGTTMINGYKRTLCSKNDGNLSTHLVICEACVKYFASQKKKISKFVAPNPLFLTGTAVLKGPKALIPALEAVFGMSRSGYVAKMYVAISETNQLDVSLSIVDDKCFSQEEDIVFEARAYIYKDGIAIKNKQLQIDYAKDQLLDPTVTTVGTAEFNFEQGEIDGKMYIEICISQTGGNSYTGFVPGASTSYIAPINYTIINRNYLELEKKYQKDMGNTPIKLTIQSR